MKTSNRLFGVPVSDQGSGVFNLEEAFIQLQTYRRFLKGDSEKTTLDNSPIIYPEILDLTSEMFSPYSLISFHSTMMPVAFNFTLINPQSPSFEILDIKHSSEDSSISSCLLVSFESSSSSPYFASIRVLLRVKSSLECQYTSTQTRNLTTNLILSTSNLTTTFQISLAIIPTPARSNRLLFDVYHNLKFPEHQYVLRDSIFVDKQPYEWKGDHPFTNYVIFYTYLVKTLGYTVEILTEPIT